MRYVYLVYSECHGLVCVCGSEASADRKVMAIAVGEMDVDVECTPLSFNSPTCWGWDECYWRKEPIYE